MYVAAVFVAVAIGLTTLLVIYNRKKKGKIKPIPEENVNPQTDTASEDSRMSS